eukprot:15351463-Ditylum_brightwellii.AAC.1
MATLVDININIGIHFGNTPTERILQQKDLTESICQLGVKNNPAVDFTDNANNRFNISIAVTSRAILPKLGFNRNTARKIIYGSHKYSGF